MSRVPRAYIEARADEIRAAAVRAFVRLGLDRATMHDVAREAGLSAGAIYRYFDNKEALVRAVFERCGDESRNVFEQAFVTTAAPVAAIAEVGRVAWSAFSDAGALDRFALSASATIAAGRGDGGIGAEFRLMHDSVLAALGALVRRAQAAGEVDPDIDADAIALTLVACLEGLRLLFVERQGDVATDAVYETLTRMVRALAPAAKGR